MPHDDGSAPQVRGRGVAFTLADFTHSIMLMETISRVEHDLAESLRAMAARDVGDAAARRLRLAADAARGAEIAAVRGERLREQARQWAERAEVVTLHQALDHAAAVLVDLERAESDLAGILTNLASYGDPNLTARWRQLAAEAAAAAQQARDRAHALHQQAQTEGAATRAEGIPAAETLDGPVPSGNQRLDDIDRKLTELRQARSERPPARDMAQAVAEAQQRAQEADRILQTSDAHLRHARQLAEKALLRAATAHDRAAAADDRAARAGIGDVTEHKRMAAVHRAAADADRQRAREIQSQVADPVTTP